MRTELFVVQKFENLIFIGLGKDGYRNDEKTLNEIPKTFDMRSISFWKHGMGIGKMFETMKE